MDIKSQVAAKYQVPVGDLVAVLFYSDRSYTSVTVYGTHLKSIERYVKDTNSGTNNKQFSANGWAELKAVPENGNIVKASVFGIEEGNILLVSGYPPNQ